MASSDAQYFHSTPHKFTLDASKAIIADFCARINDVSARCWYDAEQDIFCLTCPTSIGYEVDLALGDAISKYMETELAAAEREDRACKVYRFTENGLDVTEDAAAPTLTVPTSSENCALQKQLKLLILHSISIGASPTTLVKFFRLRDLPEGVLERTLVVGDARNKKIFATSMTCRVTRWSQSKQEYIFNGRVGTPSANTNNIPDNHIFNSTPFITIKDEKMSATHSEHEITPPVRYFRFVGDKPSVNQWVEGMGQTEPEEPEYMPEPPRDAEKFQNRAFQQKSSIGRVRIPKGVKVNTDSSDEDEEDQQLTNQPNSELDFSQLFHSNDKTGGGDEESKTNLQTGGTTGYADNDPFENLFKSSQKKAKTAVVRPPALASSNTTSIIPTRFRNDTQKTSTWRSTRSTEAKYNSSDSNAGDYFPESNRFAKVDNIGLTSNAANQAEWEHSNPAPRKTKTNRSGIGFKASSKSATDSGSTATMSQITPEEPELPPGLPVAEKLSALGASTQRTPSYVNAKSDAMPWTNKVNRPKGTQKKIVDDSSDQSPSPVKIPLGYDYGQPKGGAQSTPTTQRNLELNQTSLRENRTQMLIDLTDDNTEIPKAKIRMPALKAPLIPTDAQSTRVSTEMNENYGINERLQLDKNKTDGKKYTMRQKAGKKSKDSNQSSKKNRKPLPVVHLPKPDPLPPPKKALLTQREASGNDSATSTAKPEASGSKSSPSVPQIRSSTSTTEQQNNMTPLEPAGGLQKLLQDINSSKDMTGAELDIYFGVILLRHLSDKNFLNGVHDRGKMEIKVQNAASDLHSDFIPRITTSETEAKFLLDLFDGSEPRARVEYEIYIKTSEGEPRLVRFEQITTEDFLVLRTDTAVAKLFMHYPMRVWDAQTIIAKEEIDFEMMKAVGLFVESIQTAEEAPSFLAVVPSHLFTVEKVYAKRIFSKIADAVEVKVIEVQHLALNSINSDRFNFKASASPKDVMIAEQRLWWECSLHVGPVESVQIKNCQEMVDHFVSKMDGIGYDNNGPFERTEVEESLDQSNVEIPFW